MRIKKYAILKAAKRKVTGAMKIAIAEKKAKKEATDRVAGVIYRPTKA